MSADVFDLFLLESAELAVTKHTRQQHSLVKLTGMCRCNGLVEMPISRVCSSRMSARLQGADIRLKVLKDMSSASFVNAGQREKVCPYCQSRRLRSLTIVPHASHHVSS